MSQKIQLLFQLIIFYLLITKCRVKSDLFSSLAAMEELFKIEAVIIEILDNYIQIETDKIAELKTKLDVYKKEHIAASNDLTTYISHPIRAYLLIKRLTSDWYEIKKKLSNDLGKEVLEDVSDYQQIVELPTIADLKGAASAILLLQDTYNLETSSIASGELNGIQYNIQMAASDCFVLGRQAFNNSDYYYTELWMREALKRLSEEQNETIALKSNIFKYLAFATFKQGDFESAFKLADEVLENVPGQPRAVAYKAFFDQVATIYDQDVDYRLKADDGSSALVEKEQFVRQSSYDNFFIYRNGMCRNEIHQPEHELAKLHCRYVTNKSPFLRIAPLKLEEVHLDPYIVIYHEVMYDSEIEMIKELAKPKLERSLVRLSDEIDSNKASNRRIGKTAWLYSKTHRFIRNIKLRVQDMTGLSTKTAEGLQVVNYGIGGHYAAHYDFGSKFMHLGLGDRIATVLFYMSDVPQGGATVFPMVNATIWPKKGTAAFWMNLFKSGKGNYLMRHVACPVLMGSKWISTIWLNSIGQEWTRPCGLQPDD